MKYTTTVLQKYEKILSEAGYTIRYEKGNFQSGYCILEARKVVVINKFLDTEGRTNALIELINLLPINLDLLTHESQKLLLATIKNPEAAIQHK